jgi:hypothetical protein
MAQPDPHLAQRHPCRPRVEAEQVVGVVRGFGEGLAPSRRGRAGRRASRRGTSRRGRGATGRRRRRAVAYRSWAPTSTPGSTASRIGCNQSAAVARDVVVQEQDDVGRRGDVEADVRRMAEAAVVVEADPATASGIGGSEPLSTTSTSHGTGHTDRFVVAVGELRVVEPGRHDRWGVRPTGRRRRLRATTSVRQTGARPSVRRNHCRGT